MGLHLKMQRAIPAVIVVILLCGLTAWAENQSPPTTSAQAAPAPKLDAPVAVNEASPPSADELAKGDPGGSKTGTVNDIAVTDSIPLTRAERDRFCWDCVRFHG